MNPDDDSFLLCIAAVRVIDPGATVEAIRREDDPRLIARLRVTLGPGATTEIRAAVRRALDATAQARWGIVWGGDHLPS